MKKILIAIDCQKGFLNGETEQTAQNIKNLVCSDTFDNIVATKFVHEVNSPFSSILSFKKMTQDKEETELIFNRFELTKIDYVLEKQLYSCVNDKLLDTLYQLNSELPSKVYLCGFDTDACVLKSVLDLFELGIEPIVLKDCCASSGGQQLHESALKILQRNVSDCQTLGEEQ